MVNKLGTALGGAASGAAAGTAILPGWGTAIGGIIGGLGGLISGGESAEAKAAREAADDIKNNWEIATPEQRQYALEYYQSVGQFSPEMEAAILQEASAAEQISLDPAYQQAQRDALARLELKLQGGGFDLEDEARMLQAQRDAARDAQGNREAIMARMAQQGMSGAGQELAMQLQAAQGAQDMQAQQQLNIAAEANRRQGQLIQDKFNLARNMQQDEYGRDIGLADRRDALSRFNVQTRQDVQQRNVDRSNQAQQYDLQYARDLSNKNVDLRNTYAQDQRNQRLAAAADKNQGLLARHGMATTAGKAQDATEAAASKGWIDTMTGAGTVAVGAKNAGLLGTKKV
jgi:hypothetical protein